MNKTENTERYNDIIFLLTSFPPCLSLIVCSTASTQYWIYDVGAEVKEDHLWNAWKYNNQTAGYVTEFDLGETDSSFLFVTVHGAGHEVPAYRPSEALAMFKSFFSDEWDIEDRHLL